MKEEPTVLEMYRELLDMYLPKMVMYLTDEEIKDLWYKEHTQYQ